MANKASLLNPLSNASDRAASLWEGDSYKQKDMETASQEFKNPIKKIYNSTRAAIGDVFLATKTIGKKTASYIANVATSTAALPANIGKWALDLVRVIPRATAVGTDIVAQQTFGRVSKIINNTNKKIQAALGQQDLPKAT